MPDYLLLMHGLPAEAPDGGVLLDWEPYLAGLRAAGQLRGGSEIGAGVCVQKTGVAPEITNHLTGFIRVEATDLTDARRLLVGNPVFEAGGTIEIRELVETTGKAPRMKDTLKVEERKIDDAVFQNCSMRRSQFQDVDLSGAVFTDVNLRAARFNNINLAGVVVTDANIDGLVIHGHDILALIKAEIARRR